MYGQIITSPRGNLTLHQSLQLASFFLEHAAKTQDSDIALVFCHETEVSLSQTKKAARNADDATVQRRIGTAYIGLGRILESRGLEKEAKAIYKKAEKLGVNVGDQDQLVQPSQPSISKSIESLTNQKQGAAGGVSTNGNPTQQKTIPYNIFDENVPPHSAVIKLPDTDERLTSTLQLTYCLALLRNSHTLDKMLEQHARKWLQVVENDEDEQERLNVLATNVIRTFKKEEIKDSRAVAEVVCLAPILDKEAFRDLLKQFYDGISHSELLDFHQLEGLAQMIQGVDPDYVQPDDLVKILDLLSRRLQDTHQQSPQYRYQLVLAVSCVLDAMADTRVEEIDRETLHEPLLKFLGSFKATSDPFLMYQVAYAYQALLCVPDNETLWQAALRRTSKVIKGLSGLVSAVKGFDLNGFIDGLTDVQQGLAGASDVFKVVVSTFDDIKSLTDGGKGFLQGLKEGLSFQRKCAWYAALRGADALIQDGEFVAFGRLVCEAPCRMDPAFQWGVCQRLAEIATSSTWDARTRRGATSFLAEIYRNDEDWGDQASIKEWVITLLMRLASSTGNTAQFAETLVRELESSVNGQKRVQLQSCREKDLTLYPVKATLTPLTSSALLDRVQSKPDVEGSLRLLRKQRLKERGAGVYIQPQAKASMLVTDSARFPLMENVKEFLESDQKVFLLLGDSGAGKSTFNRQLECNLWEDYKKNTGRIPLHINLPTIDKPEQDMVAKRLRKAEFTEPEIRELKTHRRFILICDGYDESQQTHNLYMSNRLNQPGEWDAQMIISCRSEYLGVDYRDRFQPGDRNHASESGKFKEVVITPFSEDQVNDYIKQYVSLNQPLWDTAQYTQALDLIPSLKDLVKNPFLMALSLEVLPRMMDPGAHLSATRITRVALYDEFIEHWLERGKKRLGEKELTLQAKVAFEGLVDEGFTRNGIDFMKRLAVAIYKEQRGQPIVQYSRVKDGRTWKAEFFNREDETQLLREAIPLTRSGNQYRFIHRSLLEYGLALAICDPQDWKEKLAPTSTLARRGSTDSSLSFQSIDVTQDVAPSMEYKDDLSSPLAWRNLLNDPSILEFLKERVQQEPIFKQQLLDCIEHSKTDVRWRKAASNAITILIRADVWFNGADFRGIKIPGADLSYGMFDSAQLQGADLRHVNLRSAWLRQADLTEAVMTGSHFWEGPFFKEKAGVCSCAYSPDGRSLTVGLVTGDIRVYSTSAWQPVQTLSGHSDRVRDVKYSPNGAQLASCSLDNTIRLWNVEHGTPLRTLTGHEQEIYTIAYAPCGRALVSASADCTARVWDVDTGGCRLIFISQKDDFMSVAYSPSGNEIAFKSWDHLIRLWDVDTGECHRILDGHTSTAWCIAYSPQDDRIACGSTNGNVCLWDLNSNGPCRILTGHRYIVHCVAFSPRGDLLASAGRDDTVRLWKTDTGDCIQVLKGHTSVVFCVAFSPKSDHIASGGADNTVRLWVVGSGVNYQVSSSRSTGAWNVKFSLNGNKIASGHEDGTIRLWDAETGSCHTLSGHSAWVKSIDYLPSGERFVTASYDDTVRVWDVNTEECRQAFTPNHDQIRAIVYSPQENQVASGSRDGTIKLWDLKSGECSHILIGDHNWVNMLAYSPDGKRIAAGCYGGTVRLWDVQAGGCIRTLSRDTSFVMHLAFSPRGNVIVSMYLDNTMRLWDAESGTCRIILMGRSETWYPVNAFSPLGNQVTSGSRNGNLRLWDVATGDCIHTLTGHTEMVTIAKFTPDGLRVLSGSEDKTLRFWDVASGRCLTVFKGLSSTITDIAWDPTSDILRFVTGASDGSVQLWRMEEGNGQINLHLCWGTAGEGLVVSGASIQGVKGLSRLNMQLLEQRGAIGEPY